jgi:PAS domain S-box-containing protein
MEGHAMFDSRTKARSLASLYAGGALVGVLTLALPHTEAVDEGPILGLALLALAFAGAGLRWADRVTEPMLHVAVVAATAMITLAVHFTAHSTLYALMYTWPALYAFYVFGALPALGHLAVVGVGYGIVLAADETTDAPVRLVLVLGTPLVVGLIISRLLSRVQETLERSDRQERALRTGEQRTRLLVDSARDGFIATDTEGRVLDLNAAAERLLGRHRDTVLGLPFHELALPPAQHADYQRRRAELLDRARREEGGHLALNVEIDRPDGTRLQAEWLCWVVGGDEEQLLNARLTDIGERLRQEQARERIIGAEAARAAAERATATIARLQAVADAALTLRDPDELAHEMLLRIRDVLDADAAALLLLAEDGTLTLAASGFGESLPEAIPADAGLAGRVLATGGPVRLDAPFPADVADPRIFDARITGLLGVPLVGHEGHVLGVLEVGVRAARALTDDDADLLRLAADRAALAIDHARAFGREHRIAETLQRSLLPGTLPALPGAALAARYLPAAAESEVGGDWYDAVPLDGGRVLLVMGDVSGKGLAAASTLGALRNAIRAYALEGHGPAAMAERLNRLILADADREHMTTLVLAIFDPVESRLRWVNAGHPPPLALDPADGPRFLGGHRSVPLGVLPFAGYEDEETDLPPGGALVLYTDGLVERRGEHLDAGLQAAAAAAADGVLEPEALCNRLLQAVLPPGPRADDIALLALCHVPLGDRLELELPAEAAALRSLRALLRRWLEQAEASDADIHAIVMACSEAVTNAIEHAGVESAISFRADLRGRIVEASVRDRGVWRETVPPGDQGRGLELMEALMDDVALEPAPDGTTVRLRRRLCEAVSA